jgi:hypothetical protein
MISAGILTFITTRVERSARLLGAFGRRLSLVSICLTVMSFFPAARAVASEDAICSSAILSVQVQLGDLYSRAHATGSKPLYKALQSRLALSAELGTITPDLSQTGKGPQETETANRQKALDEGSKLADLNRFIPLDEWSALLPGTHDSITADFSLLTASSTSGATLYNMLTKQVRKLSDLGWLLSPKGTHRMSFDNGRVNLREMKPGATLIRKTWPNFDMPKYISAAVDDFGRYVLVAPGFGGFVWIFGESKPSAIPFQKIMSALTKKNLTGYPNIEFSADSRYLIITYAGHNIATVWDTTTGSEVLEVSPSEYGIRNVKVSHDRKSLGVIQTNGVFSLYSAKTGKQIFQLGDEDSYPIWDFAISKNGKNLYLSLKDRIDVYEINAGTIVESLVTKHKSRRLYFDATTEILSSLWWDDDGHINVERWRKP